MMGSKQLTSSSKKVVWLFHVLAIVRETEDIEVVAGHVTLAATLILVVNDVFTNIVVVLEHVVAAALVHHHGQHKNQQHGNAHEQCN